MGTDPRPGRAAGAWPLLVGALCGSLVAGRLETALLCLVLGGATAARLGARWPSAGWLAATATGMGFAWALNLYLTPGTALGAPWPSLFGRQATREGLLLGGLLMLRLGGALLAVQGLRAALPGDRVADLVARWLAPLERLGIPVRDSRTMAGLALRFAPLIRLEARRIARAQDLRAGRPPRGPGEWLTRRRAATLPTMVCVLERAERVALALEARHYRLRPAVDGARPGLASLPWTVAGGAVAALSILWRGP